MSAAHETLVAGGPPPLQTVPVWDVLVRVFHWSLVPLFALPSLSGEHAGQVHVIAGYAIAGLLALRILWGFVGPPRARFSDFVRPPAVALAYLREALVMRAR